MIWALILGNRMGAISFTENHITIKAKYEMSWLTLTYDDTIWKIPVISINEEHYNKTHVTIIY